ncbi:formate--tetrahydrofolate ligase [Allofustis seminis]|uniref:formate--tetrahydrofolate ligase n=1 Tax=Allofustis seminis TaxID=166939 RepID=UPI00035F8310|nr:formate--tetrahydrofolate ligase [Allofustis seminis]
MAKSDIEIAQSVTMQPIDRIAEKLAIHPEQLEHYGPYKAKVHVDPDELSKRKRGKLILVTAINPTAAGEGKTTVSIGLADGLNYIGEKVCLALREPSLGPVFGIKGGAAGGGHSQLVPMEDLNLHFTGDMHAIGAANNLAAAMIDNHIHQGNELQIDPRRIVWRRAVDMNDRQLRQITSGLGGPLNGMPREDGFDITVASEVMAILCLSTSLSDLKQRLSRAVIGYTYDRNPVTIGDLGAEEAMTILLKDALKPNLVQTLEGTPAFVHGGPFANIAHGCNSVLATQSALAYADYAVTEAGFGADLGAEKFLDIKCRMTDLAPDAVVVVATIRALKLHGGVAKDQLQEENVKALQDGSSNLLKHIENLQHVYNQNVVVAINAFVNDTAAEIQALQEICQQADVPYALCKSWEQGGSGAEALAHLVVDACHVPSTLTYPYALEDSLEAKIAHVIQKVYGGKASQWSVKAKRVARQLKRQGYGHLPICMAKTQYSLSDNPRLLGRPKDFEVAIKDLTVSAGAGFIVVLTGDVMKMPGLPKDPAATHMTIDDSGKINGLF